MKKEQQTLNIIADLFDNVQILIDKNNPEFGHRVTEIRCSIEYLKEDLTTIKRENL